MADVTHAEAREILQRFINSHFDNPGETARFSIPTRVDRDDDCRMSAYIEQREAFEAEVEKVGRNVKSWKELTLRMHHAEEALVEVDMILRVVGADRDFRRKMLCAMRDRAEQARDMIAKVETKSAWADTVVQDAEARRVAAGSLQIHAESEAQLAQKQVTRVVETVAEAVLLLQAAHADLTRGASSAAREAITKALSLFGKEPPCAS